jgi:hypothetical protein
MVMLLKVMLLNVLFLDRRNCAFYVAAGRGTLESRGIQADSTVDPARPKRCVRQHERTGPGIGFLHLNLSQSTLV